MLRDLAFIYRPPSLKEIKREVRMPEYARWASQERFPTNVEAAYKIFELF